ncbi:DUF7507 domain-containing protein [Nocardioides nitrophenolicus]|uniref:DUF7507 domain-containing protein n=1 Tax=Nocardioides nitrophenolicus TaxID=60489 RepID=UPI00195BF457|nr:DUF11 domain-containing protein [Nocardioides nitrophenolicus]MBM7517815.1 putative repeat protein (TIGR01451 family) [Nocardioides nitrophenolicus]
MRLAGIAALATATATISIFGTVPSSHADPATPPDEPTTLALGEFEQAAAPGSCAAIVTLEGGNGGTAISGADNDDDEPTDDPDQVGGGQGARVQFRIPVSPTDVLTGVVGRGGASGGLGGASGDDKGGNGGTGTHAGAGGGGYTSLLVNGDLVALVGGGGGSGGGHNPNAGGGGHAGVIEGQGTFAGQDGADGVDRSTTPRAPGGGGAGGTNAAGTGGVHADKPADNGSDGSGRNGGNGGGGDGADQGGGGGAGYFGGGGGATTVGDVDNGTPDPTDPTVGTGVVGGGGGGGSSFFSGTHGATLIDQAEGESLAPNGASRNGTGEIEWVPCNYDLSVTKTAAAEVFESGTPVTYTLVITNNGPDLMGIDDTVTVTDDKAGGGTLVSVQASGSGTPFTCDTAVGSAIPADGELDCSRPVGSDVRGLDNGEKLTLVYSKVLTGNAPVLNNVGVTDRGNPANNTAAATVQPAVPGVSLVKKATPKKVAKLGEKIKYTFKVTNTGNIALKTVTIAEQQFSGKGSLTPKCPALPATGLAPGASITCTATYKVHKRDLVAGKVVNVATASGTTPAGNPVQSLPSKAKVKTPKQPKKVAGTPATGARSLSGR